MTDYCPASPDVLLMCLRQVAYQTLQKLDEFEAHHVADLVTAYAIMVHHPGDLLLRLTAHIYTRLENMSAGAVEGLFLCSKTRGLLGGSKDSDRLLQGWG